ncbi:MAG: DUF4105 domain-containing protein [Ginsengibacter sp.]
MKFIIIILLFFPLMTWAQPDECHLRISLLTVSPGDDLYSTFGHSALRVTDSANNTDIVYGFGTFNFDEPGFYIKFTRGKLMYYLSRDYFESFKESYQVENRTITEQVLNLTCAEKQNVINLLNENLLPQNLYYKYDFLFDNCTTRLRDLVEKASKGEVHYGEVLKSKKTFRNLIYEYLDYNDKQWSKLGIDILLGAKTDAIMKPREVMFLPDYLMKTFDQSKIDSHALVSETQSLYKIKYVPVEKENLTHPFFIFLSFFVLIAILSFSKNVVIQKIMYSFDGFLFFVIGLLGLLLVFMWFGTDHIMCKNNYNLLWAWPTHAVAAFYIHSKKSFAKKYFLVSAIFSLIVIGLWFALPQQMNVSLIPIIGILILRSFVYISKKKN